MELEMLSYQNISGPKKRIAHIAKFHVSYLAPLSRGTLSYKVHSLSF